MHISVLLLFFVAPPISSLANSYNVTLYSLNAWKGSEFDITNNSCVNIPDHFLQINGGVSGIYTRGTCIIAYSGIDCQGNHLIMKPGTLAHGRLDLLNFENVTKSVGPCDFTRVERKFYGQHRDNLPLTLIICSCVTAANLLMYIKYLKRKKLRQLSSRPLPTISTSNDANYEMVELDDSEYQTVVYDDTLKTASKTNATTECNDHGAEVQEDVAA